MSIKNIPSKEECLKILKKNKTPSNVVEHCKAVCKIAEEITNRLVKNGIKINKKLVIAASLLHDIQRGEKDHVVEGVKVIREIGFPEVAEVIKKHTLYKLESQLNQPKTYEEKIVFYADKRVKENKVVSLEERFKDLKERYGIDLKEEFDFAKKIEKELI